MDNTRHRPAASHQREDRDSASPSAMERHRDDPNHSRHQPGSAAVQWRTEGLDFVRDAIHRTYR